MTNISPKARIFCAVDTPDLGKAETLARAVSGAVGGLKLGLEFFSALGGDGVRAMKNAGVPIFLDLKLHDIPNTVASAVRVLAPLGVDFMTIHTTGGRAMMEAAAKAAREAAEAAGVTRPRILGVTVLTSMDDSDLAAIGVASNTAGQVLRLARLARTSGLDGIVCSPHEIAMLRAELGPDFILMVPGIRPAGSAVGDQKRVMTPAEAIAAGADYLVIGRPITEADDPRAAALAIAASMEEPN